MNCPFRRVVAGVGAVLGVLWACQAEAQRSDPADAVVFIRVFGTARTEYEDTWKKTVERRGIQIATGSGFVISPSGYIITNHHVVSGDEVAVRAQGRDLTIKVTIERIDVVFASGQELQATVFASDAEMDLAVLSVGGAGFPYVPFGDSDAVESGAAINALGYPFGQALEVGRSDAGEASPGITRTAGTISAVRQGDDGDPRYLQVASSLNPGGSGGPVVDDEGYAVGVVAMKVAKSEGLAFTIAINRVKDFLERVGLDGELPTRRLRLGAPTDIQFKGLRVRMPEGFRESDRAYPFATQPRLHHGAADSNRSRIELNVDRLASTWRPEEVEQALLSGQIIDGQPYETDARRPRSQPRGLRLGRAATTTESGERLVIEHAIASTGTERIVARYTGPADEVAFNLGVLRESLKSLEVEPLLRGEPVPPPAWSGQILSVEWPATNWQTSADLPVVCPIRDEDRRRMSSHSAGSPEQDFTQTLRVRPWLASLEAVQKVCPQARASNGYRLETPHAGIRYRIEGFFVEVEAKGERVVMQIEAVAPVDRGERIYQWLREWKALLEKR